MSETQDQVGKRVREAFERLALLLKNAKTQIVREQLYPRVDKKDNGLYVGYIVASKKPLLLLRCEKKIAEKIKFPKKRDWFDVYPKSYETEQRQDYCLTLELTDWDCVKLFNLLVTYVVKNVFDVIVTLPYAANRDKHLAGEFNRSVKKWSRENKAKDEVLTIPKQRGLFAELWFLRDYAMEVFGVEAAIDYWVGPQGKAHDFQFPLCGVEVKAVSADKDDPEIRISNEFQLDPIRRNSENGAISPEKELRLFLFCLFLRDAERDENEIVAPEYNQNKSNREESSDVGKTLFEMVDTLRSHIKQRSQGALDKFQTNLVGAGYRRKHEDEYKKIRLKSTTCIRPSFYEIADRSKGELFPRIVRSDVFGTGVQLPSSIRKVKYYLRLDDIRAFSREESDVMMHISGRNHSTKTASSLHDLKKRKQTLQK